MLSQKRIPDGKKEEISQVNSCHVSFVIRLRIWFGVDFFFKKNWVVLIDLFCRKIHMILLDHGLISFFITIIVSLFSLSFGIPILCPWFSELSV